MTDQLIFKTPQDLLDAMKTGICSCSIIERVEGEIKRLNELNPNRDPAVVARLLQHCISMSKDYGRSRYASKISSIRDANFLLTAIEQDKNALVGAKLFGADLSGVRLNGANLKGADLRRAILNHTQLKGTNLCNVNFDEALLDGVSIDGETQFTGCAVLLSKRNSDVGILSNDAFYTDSDINAVNKSLRDIDVLRGGIHSAMKISIGNRILTKLVNLFNVNGGRDATFKDAEKLLYGIQPS